MKLPLFWLKDYVDIDCSPEELEEKLFSCGFEVEEVIRVNGNVDKIVTCKVIKIEKVLHEMGFPNNFKEIVRLEKWMKNKTNKEKK